MKRIPNWVYLFLAVVLFGGIMWYSDGQPVEYKAPESPLTVTETIVEDLLEERIKSAQNAKMSELEAAAQEAYEASMQNGLKAIELEVIEAYQVELDEREQTLEKEVGTY